MAAKLEESSSELYERCTNAALSSPEGRAKIFGQDELLKMGVVDSAQALLELVQGLMDAQLIRLMQMEGKICYALRTKDDAAKIVTLNDDERMVYNQIENSGTNGTWTKTIKQRTNIHQTTVTKAMKTLESKKLVKPVKSIKNPAQKIYMLYHLSPNEDVTGGPWFSDGELDVELIAITADAVIHFIAQNSWKTVYIKREATPDADGVSKKRKRNDTTDIEGSHPKSRRAGGYETQISYPAGWRGYPTVSAIHHFITEAGFLKDSSALAESDLQNLLDVLVFDERIEKIGNGYRTCKGVFGATEAMKNIMQGRQVADAVEEVEGNGLSQAPCGRCPVFNLCEDGGPVNAKNCEYFQTWLRA
ncbi:RNA polymerase Rpc34, partial [Aureobasidium melanogenum]|jgi:DNA-directed RNA polymerase III subunit RPC6